MSIPEIDLDVSELAKKLGIWMSENSEFGLEEAVNGEQLETAFQGEAEDELEDALAELEAAGVVTTRSLMNTNLPRVRPTLDLFAVFDPATKGSTPYMDAAELLDVILSDKMESVSVPGLHEKIGWPIRRFNPAIAYVIGLVDEGRVSNETGSYPYPVRHFHVAAPDRVEMRQFLKQLRG